MISILFELQQYQVGINSKLHTDEQLLQSWDEFPTIYLRVSSTKSGWFFYYVTKRK
jgi:hypothetical protein